VLPDPADDLAVTGVTLAGLLVFSSAGFFLGRSSPPPPSPPPPPWPWDPPAATPETDAAPYIPVGSTIVLPDLDGDIAFGGATLIGILVVSAAGFFLGRSSSA
jgi:hypothetical protein